jgi:DNA-binding NarL/FixJ family response regulator
VIADDHKIFLDGLYRILEPHFDVVGMVRNGRELLHVYRETNPDAALVDVSMPMLNGIEATRQLKKIKADAKVLLLTMHREVAFAAEAFRAGASGYVLKDADTVELIRAIREVLAGRYYLTPMITRETLSELLQRDSAAAPTLTPRQREVLQLISEGGSLKHIAHQLNVSVSTVEFHKAAIMRRLGANSTADLIRYSLSSGISTM